MDVHKAGMARLFLAAPELRDQQWMTQDAVFLKLCAAYEEGCLRRDILRCSSPKDDHALLKAERKCRSLEAAAIAYVHEHQKFSGIV